MPDRDDILQRLVDDEVARGAPSCLLRVEAPAQAYRFAGAAGSLRRDHPAPAAPTDAFRIASVTKPFTATVVLQLAQEGALTLDTHVVDVVDTDVAELVRRVHVLDGKAYGDDITVRHLLSHASGVFDYATSAGFIAAVTADPARPWDPRELVDGAARWGEPHFPPGQRDGYAYADTGYVIAGLAIEHVAGRPLHAVYRQRILDRLDLSDTFLEGYEAPRGPALTHAYQGVDDAMVIHGSADWAGGGLVSTTADLARFATALVEGALLDADLSREQLRWEFRTLDPSRRALGLVGYGLGVDARVSHGRILRGHRGHWGVLMHAEPATGLVITGTVNAAAMPPHALMHAVVAALAGR